MPTYANSMSIAYGRRMDKSMFALQQVNIP